MSCTRYLHALLNVIICLLVFRSQFEVCGSVGRLFLFLAFAALLFFVVEHASDITNTLASALRSAVTVFFALGLQQENWRQLVTEPAFPAKPLLPFSFQRPPPPAAA